MTFDERSVVHRVVPQRDEERESGRSTGGGLRLNRCVLRLRHLKTDRRADVLLGDDSLTAGYEGMFGPITPVCGRCRPAT